MEILRVPLLNANEDELDVVDVLVQDMAEVKAGDVICVLESTKTTFDLEAPVAGFVRLLSIQEGDRVRVGAVLCVVTATLEEEIALPQQSNVPAPSAGSRATKKALELAQAHGIELTSLGIEGIIKERDVQAFLDAAQPAKKSPSQPSLMASSPLAQPSNRSGERVLIFGAGGHARVLIDLIREGRRDLVLSAVIDDAAQVGDTLLGVPIVGNSEQLAGLREQGIALAILGVGAVTNNKLRIKLYERLVSLGFTIPSLVHPRAIVEPSAQMGSGNQVFGGAIVSSGVRLGDNTIINSGAVVSHDCTIGSHTHITPGAILAGNVSVGENTVIGMGATVYLGVNIGKNVVIANGIHVMHDIPDNSVIRSVR
ncbi:MAG: NeuD/PglB/VioB family sugar acetyltransferase [Bradymonadaceae bacterium]|nr:NeuD/PglB/VioB family sugar acetyltransferase [Lujinxingiaceae bacterium]